MGEDVWIIDIGGKKGWFLLLEEGVYDQHSDILDAEVIPLQRLGFV